MNTRFKRIISMILSLAMTISSMTVITQQAFAADLPTIYLVGDSTGCHYSESTDNGYYYKRVGFGDKLADYFDTTQVNISNLAMSGRSSLSFTTESNYTTLKNNIKSGDILLIAFGHNDEKTTDGLYTEPLGDKNTAGSFKNSLYTNYVQLAQAAGATPILCSPIVRLPSGDAFTAKDLHQVNGGDYAQCAIELASELGIGSINLTGLTQAKYLEVGLTEAANYHAMNNLLTIDKTHINNYGAKMVASLIAANAPSGLSEYVLAGAAAPDKATDLVVDPSYVDPATSGEATDDLTGDALNSSLWTTTSPWHGSVYGVIGATVGGTSFMTNYDIAENADASEVTIKALGNKSKLSATVDGLAFYYQPISALENFQVIADVHVNSVDNTNSQVSFGAMMTDKIEVDTRNQSTDGYDMGNYVVAGPYKMASAKSYAGFVKNNSVIEYESVLPKDQLPAAGSDVHVSISKSGTYYTVTYQTIGTDSTTGEAYAPIVSNFQLSETQMKGVVYAGFFASRNADVTFSNIVYNNEVVEDIMEPVEAPTVDPTQAADFTFWADEKADADGNFASGAYGAAGSVIQVTNKNKTLPKYSTGNLEGHQAYKISKYTASPYGSVTFTPAADGWATLYFYVEEGKSYYVNSTAIDKSGADYTVTTTPFTFPVEYGKSYNICTSATSNFSFVGMSYKMKVAAAISGNVTVDPASTNTIESGSILTFTNNTTGESYDAVINADGSYTVNVDKDFEYTCSFSGTDTLIIDKNSTNTTVSVSAIENTFDIILKDAEGEEITGTVYGPANTSVNITIGDQSITVVTDEKGVGTYNNVYLKPGTYTVTVDAIDGWNLSDLSTTDLVVKHNGTENYKNILYTQPVAAATDYNVYVDQAGTYYTTQENVYSTITDAMAAIDASSLKGSAAQRFIVHVAPGTYEEQYFVNANYVSLIADSDGDSVADGNVIATWYYGIDYKYYSIDPATGFYDKAYAVDKHTKTTCEQKWGATMIVKGSNFYTEGITYQNTFNIELRDAELADGVENDPTNSSNNTTYDRTQPNADVKLTTATERAAALAIDGQQAEFYNCKFYGSQDTIYTGNYNHYFNKCVIAGETDYIFGNGGTTIFDDCELQWIDYHYPTSSAAAKGKPGYIAVPRGSYIFRNCEITSSGAGLDVATGDDVVTAGYYGRPWGNTASAIFMNCKTNDLILEAGWNAMSGVTPSEVEFREYNNTAKDGTVFYSELTETNPETPSGATRILTDDEAVSLAAVKDWNIYGTWCPQSHVPYEGNPNIYKFDFTPSADSVVSPVSDESGKAQITHTGFTYHGTSYGMQSGKTASLTIYAGMDSASMEIAVNSSYNGNAGTLYLYKNDDETTAIDSIAFDNTVDNETVTFTVNDIKAGDTYTIKYDGAQAFYCGNVTVTSDDAVLTNAPATYKFNYKAIAADGANGTQIPSSLESDIAGAAMLSAGTVTYHDGGHGVNAATGSKFTFNVAEAGKTTITMPFSYCSATSGSIDVKDANGNTVGQYTVSGTEGNAFTAEIKLGEIPVGDYTITNNTNKELYVATISIMTTGALGSPVPANTYVFNFNNDSTLAGQAIPTTINSTSNEGDPESVPMTIAGNVYYHNSTHGVQAKSGSSFTFNVAEAGTTTIEMPFTYCNVTSGTLDVTDANGNPVASYTFTADTASPITIELGETAAGNYTITNNTGKDLYVPSITVTTTGTLGTPTEPITANSYVFDFNNDSTLAGQAIPTTINSTSNEGDPASVPMTIAGNVYYHNSTHGVQAKSGSSFTFNVAEAGTTTIEMPFTYCNVTSGTLDVTDANGNPVASYTFTADTASPITIELGETAAGNYTITNNTGKDLYVPSITVTTTGTLGTPTEPITANSYVFDFNNDSTLAGQAIPTTINSTSNEGDPASVPMTIAGNVYYHNSTHGVQAKSGSSFTFNVAEAGTTTIEMPFTYCNVTSGTLDVTDANGNPVASYTFTADTASPITIELGETAAGNYTITNNTGKDLYVPSITVTTTGTLGTPAAPIVYNDYSYDFTVDLGNVNSVNGDPTSRDMKATENELAKVTLSDNKFAFKDTSNGYQVNAGSVIGFALSGEGTIAATVKVESGYAGAEMTISVWAKGADKENGTPIGTITIPASGYTTSDANIEVPAGDYELVFNNNNTYIKNVTISVPETAGIGARPDVRGELNNDGTLTLLDAVALLQNYVGSEITDEMTLNADYNLDKKIDKLDAAGILKAAIKNIA